MPYETIVDLPKSVRDHLPLQAQEIYRQAFNNAWEEYARPEDRMGDDSREATAHKVAWSAVKQVYEKRNDKWVRKHKSLAKA